MSSSRRRLRPIIGTAISIVLVYLVLFRPQIGALFGGDVTVLEALFGRARIGIEDLRAAGDRLVWGYALLAIALLVAQLFLRAWRWRIMLKQVGAVEYWTVFHCINLGYLLNNILPLRAGEVIRGVIVARRSQLSATAILATVAAERVFDLAGLGVVFGLVTVAFPFPGWLQTAGLAFMVAVLAMLVTALLLTHSQDRLRRWHDALARRGSLLRNVGEKVLRLVDGLTVLRSPVAMLHIAWSSLVLWAVYITILKLVLDAFQLTGGAYPGLSGGAWLPAAVVTIITALGFAIPSAPGGVGTYHGAVLLAMSWFDVPEGMAVIFAAVMHALNYLTLSAMGLVSLALMKLRLADIVRTAKKGGAD
ncbi:MAG: hypothetical protein MAG453_00895 [Calditrichaeota bacterium]|nr:hypothetical protein [Calditrichota bacterium]